MANETFVICDPPPGGRYLPVIVEGQNGKLEIRIKGYGDYYSDDDAGTPILLEVNNGVVQLVVWSDINQQDPTHVIKLEDAREDKRKDESDNEE